MQGGLDLDLEQEIHESAQGGLVLDLEQEIHESAQGGLEHVVRNTKCTSPRNERSE